MKAKDLIAILQKNPEATVVFDDTCSEYIYSVDVIDPPWAGGNFISLTWDTEVEWMISGGILTRS